MVFLGEARVPQNMKQLQLDAVRAQAADMEDGRRQIIGRFSRQTEDDMRDNRKAGRVQILYGPVIIGRREAGADIALCCRMNALQTQFDPHRFFPVQLC